MPTLTGAITIVQEARFQVVDDQGAGHLFVLGTRAACEPAQLKPLARRQARVRVTYEDAPRVIALQARKVELL